MGKAIVYMKRCILVSHPKAEQRINISSRFNKFFSAEGAGDILFQPGQDAFGMIRLETTARQHDNLFCRLKILQTDATILADLFFHAPHVLV